MGPLTFRQKLQVFDAEDHFQLRTPVAEHVFPTEICAEAYKFLDEHLQHEPAGKPDFADELPRIQPVAKHEAIKTFQIADGFRIQQIAAEPLIADPVAACFDADGRLYVVEMRGYSEQRNENLGRIIILEDRNQDGVFDKRTVFADGLSWPTALICFDGGVFVGAAPDIVFMKDTDGDLVADRKTVVFTGFGKSNVQGLLNSFRWGLDNRIHGATSSSGGMVRRPDQPESRAINLNRRDFSFDPRKLDIRAESGGAQHGMAFDDWGRKFLCSNSDHLQMIVYDDRYAARNPYLPSIPSRVSIADDGGQAPVYRTSPIEPWRIVRTRLRVSGLVRGPVEGGGRPGGYFTGSTGVTIYRGDAWPSGDRGLAIVGDVGSNIIHRKRLTRQDLLHVGSRIDSKSEFVASSDVWFRPVQFANAPDGTLHVLDMYREVIEHPKSLPPEIKQHLDLTSGRNRGRIYRVIPESFQHRTSPKLSRLSSRDMVILLSHSNSWHRETASRLLFERQDREVAVDLTAIVRESPSARARLHALYVLSGLNILTSDLVATALTDTHPMIRVHALKLAESYPGSPQIRLRISQLANDTSIDVLFQLAFTLGEFPESFRLPILNQILATNGHDQWIRFAVLASSQSGAGKLFALLSQNSDFLKREKYKTELIALIDLIAAQPERVEVLAFMESLNDQGHLSPEVQTEFLQRFIKKASARGNNQHLGIIKGGTSLKEVVRKMIHEARIVVMDTTASEENKISAIRSLSLSDKKSDHKAIVDLVGHQQAESVQLTALLELSTRLDAELQSVLLAKLPTLSPKVRIETQEVMLSSTESAVRFLDAVLNNKIAASEVNRSRLDWMMKSKSQKLATRARKVKSILGNTPRAKIVKKYQAALELQGNEANGRNIFRKRCSDCHKLEDHGYALGPNLATFRNRGKESLLLNILDPSREVTPDYLNYVLVTKKGQIHTGMLTSQNSTTITLKRAEGKESRILRVDIDRLESTGQSIMPEGLEKEISLQQMADLLEYLTHTN